KISRPQFDRALSGRGRLKARLADQAVIAGLGNLLIDEICWRARINPFRAADSLSASERRRFYQRMPRAARFSARRLRSGLRELAHRAARVARCDLSALWKAARAAQARRAHHGVVPAVPA